MKELSYSVVIRTLGNTGLKYKALLDSIAKQTIQPEEIIVAIPEGYELDYSYGNEHIVRCKKGMTTQRAAGILAAKSEYILVVDDDVEFDVTMVEELYQYMTFPKFSRQFFDYFPKLVDTLPNFVDTFLKK